LVAPARLPDVAAAISDVVDLKTPFTHGHSAAVARPALRAGECLGLDVETLGRLRLASLLRDLGRVAISNAIWEKRGPLTSGEWEQVRLHAYHSERILSCTTVLEPIAALAYALRADGRLGLPPRLYGGAAFASRAHHGGGRRVPGDDAAAATPRAADS
jgi:HD-GYP domain-containing protein (c-di-GMP phosphodiesterase class II)